MIMILKRLTNKTIITKASDFIPATGTETSKYS